MQHDFQRFAMMGHMGLEHNVGVHHRGIYDMEHD